MREIKHYGDITKISGFNVPVVDIVTGGSPCQDLSVAGLRKGLLHSDKGDSETTRSGLFIEQIRIIKEIREHDRQQRSDSGSNVDIRFLRPRYMVWENVPGAFTSNDGEDFRAVLEETARIADKNAVIPRPENGKWSNSGCILGNGWSIAWRLHDAQFWGVPQRRKRIALVADFGGESAPEILFERESVSGDFKEGRKQREGTSGCFETGIRKAILCFEPGAAQRVGGHIYDDVVSGSLRARSCDNSQAVLVLNDQGGGRMSVSTDITATIRSEEHGHQSIVIQDAYDKYTVSEECATVKQSGGNYGGGSEALVVSNTNVRKLTPIECERLQGYPDHWTDIGDWIDSNGKKHNGDADSPRYKALGNSIALPFWEWMAERMVAYIPEHPTMASLFDGIGGFPLVFSRCGCEPVWASEIEEFPIAVTKLRFPEKEEQHG